MIYSMSVSVDGFSVAVSNEEISRLIREEHFAGRVVVPESRPPAEPPLSELVASGGGERTTTCTVDQSGRGRKASWCSSYLRRFPRPSGVGRASSCPSCDSAQPPRSRAVSLGADDLRVCFWPLAADARART